MRTARLRLPRVNPWCSREILWLAGLNFGNLTVQRGNERIKVGSDAHKILDDRNSRWRSRAIPTQLVYIRDPASSL